MADPTPPRAAAPPGRAAASPPLRLRLRRLHAALAPWVMAPLLLTVSTGLGYRLLRDWGGLNRDQAHGLMVLHEGQWLEQWFGASGETLYVLANGLGLLWMLVSGAAMVWERWRRPPGGERSRPTPEPVHWWFGQALELGWQRKHPPGRSQRNRTPKQAPRLRPR